MFWNFCQIWRLTLAVGSDVLGGDVGSDVGA